MKCEEITILNMPALRETQPERVAPSYVLKRLSKIGRVKEHSENCLTCGTFGHSIPFKSTEKQKEESHFWSKAAVRYRQAP
jgi:hypothetical protein